MDYLSQPEVLASNHGMQAIGAAQRTIAFSAVASGGTGLLNFTLATHNLKKGDCFYNPAGAYAGIHRVLKVISSTVVQVAGTFGATDSGTISLTAALDIFGFWADAAPTIAAIETDSPIDTVSFIATVFIAGKYYPIPCKSIRISAGNITVVRKPVPTDLPYSNR